MRSLRPNEQWEGRIEARPYTNHTNLLFEAGGTYELTADGTWYDKTIECGPDGHDEPKLRNFRFLRRSRPNLSFALMGDVGRQRFLIGSCATVTIEKNGELTCFANDAPFTYGNNSGRVSLRIKRVS